MADERPLFLDQLPDAEVGEIEQLIEGVPIERFAFGRTLHLDELARVRLGF